MSVRPQPDAHADAVRVLTSWRPPTAAQRALTQSYLAFLICSDESGDVAWWPVDALPALRDDVNELIAAGRRVFAGL